MRIILDSLLKDQFFLKWELNFEEIHVIMTEFRAIFND
jgi:hypothetical protein